jgi:hypothetical protein|tara:strand:+ start:211 stop:411 length:201 start_codon:yes stop_codon:yes gene_type:complete
MNRIKPDYNITETITEVNGESYNVPNHTYNLNKHGHMVSYIKAGTTEIIKFKKPVTLFSKARRKFK